MKNNEKCCLKNCCEVTLKLKTKFIVRNWKCVFKEKNLEPISFEHCEVT